MYQPIRSHSSDDASGARFVASPLHINDLRGRRGSRRLAALGAQQSL
jgi:hypothetical protein